MDENGPKGAAAIVKERIGTLPVSSSSTSDCPGVGGMRNRELMTFLPGAERAVVEYTPDNGSRHQDSGQGYFRRQRMLLPDLKARPRSIQQKRRCNKWIR